MISIRRTWPPVLNIFISCISTLSALFLMNLRSKMILEACLEASRKRFLIVFRFALIGVFTSHIDPMMKISGFLAFLIPVGLISSMFIPKSVK